jgi:hypothetical protein
VPVKIVEHASVKSDPWRIAMFVMLEVSPFFYSHAASSPLPNSEETGEIATTPAEVLHKRADGALCANGAPSNSYRASIMQRIHGISSYSGVYCLDEKAL